MFLFRGRKTKWAPLLYQFGTEVITYVSLDKERGGHNVLFSQGGIIRRVDVHTNNSAVIVDFNETLFSFVQMETAKDSWSLLFPDLANNRLLWASTLAVNRFTVVTQTDGNPIFLFSPLKIILDPKRFTVYVSQVSNSYIVMLKFKGKNVQLKKDFLTNINLVGALNDMTLGASGETMYISFSKTLYSKKIAVNSTLQRVHTFPFEISTILDLENHTILAVGSQGEIIVLLKSVQNQTFTICSKKAEPCSLRYTTSVLVFNSTSLLFAGSHGMSFLTGKVSINTVT